MRMAMDELVAAPGNKPMRYATFKQLIIWVMPWPKGVPTTPDLLSRVSTGWDTELAYLPSGSGHSRNGNGDPIGRCILSSDGRQQRSGHARLQAH
jgi:hypothetical protein